nr:tRNA 2-selenouridine(34) synthase MnmH [Paracoccaceae bacterium]
MPVTLSSLSDLRALPFDTVIDVRSPAEFAEDHIPGAISLPVLSDAERARVGTIYKQDAPFAARKIGAALVARNAATHLEGPLAAMPGGWRPLVYCWRGGQRSGSFAAILREIGWRVDTIVGGYKTWRRLVLTAMHAPALQHRLVVLDGFTGTAKTALLPRLAALGVQVVDLEALAAHRGSLLGAVDRAQPSQKAWEGALALALAALDPARPVVVEAESSRIGNLSVPPAVWASMRTAPRIEIAAPVAARADYLARAYADLTADG